jgi:hypothetical protein
VTCVSGAQNGNPADWWLVCASPADLYSLISNGWHSGIASLATYPLFNLSPVQIFHNILPVGDYAFYFIVDMNSDGFPDPPVYYDGVQVYVIR